MNSADRKLNQTRRAAYAGMGLSVKDAMSSHTDRADTVRMLAQEAGVDAWDLTVREYATGATGRVVIATFTPVHTTLAAAVIVAEGDDWEKTIAQFRAANSPPEPAITATGRPYRHAASAESLDRFRKMVADDASGASGDETSASGEAPLRSIQVFKGDGSRGSSVWLVLHTDGTVRWSQE